MNIHTGAIYMKQGYRIRRPQWDSGQFLLIDKFNAVERTHLITVVKLVNKEMKEHTYETSDAILDLTPNDLLAEDWELVI